MIHTYTTQQQQRPLARSLAFIRFTRALSPLATSSAPSRRHLQHGMVDTKEIRPLSVRSQRSVA